MNLLLDTHVFLWLLRDKSLSDVAFSAMMDPSNSLYLSAASYWEICIKRSRNKLSLAPNWQQVFDEEMRINRIQWLAIDKAHCTKLIDLPFFHNDPFDRLLVAQAICDNLVLVSADENIRRYNVQILW